MRHCRLCKNETKKIVELGDFYLSTFVEKKGDNIGKCPLTLVQCPQCALVQLEHTASQSDMYVHQYWYKSGISEVIKNDFVDIIGKVGEFHDKGTWVDVGANDGTMLAMVPRSFYRIGVEPAYNLQKELAASCDKAIGKFWENVKIEKAEVVTAIGMFYDSEDPNVFIRNVKEHLTEDGVFVAQMMTLVPMIRKNDLGNICHEHLEYYSYASLVWLFEHNGLEIFRVEENDVNGGSYRLWARHFKHGSISYAEDAPNFDVFVKNIVENRDRVRSFIAEAISQGKKVYGYAASTKGNTILQFYGLDDTKISGIAERNKEKWGKLTVGTHIPIVSEEEARAHADYFLALPWGFLDAFMEREKQWRFSGGRFITHTPQFSVL